MSIFQKDVNENYSEMCCVCNLKITNTIDNYLVQLAACGHTYHSLCILQYIIKNTNYRLEYIYNANCPVVKCDNQLSAKGLKSKDEAFYYLFLKSKKYYENSNNFYCSITLGSVSVEDKIELNCKCLFSKSMLKLYVLEIFDSNNLDMIKCQNCKKSIKNDLQNLFDLTNSEDTKLYNNLLEHIKMAELYVNCKDEHTVKKCVNCNTIGYFKTEIFFTIEYQVCIECNAEICSHCDKIKSDCPLLKCQTCKKGMKQEIILELDVLVGENCDCTAICLSCYASLNRNQLFKHLKECNKKNKK